MNDSNKILNEEEDSRDWRSLFKKRLPFTYRFFIKDVEISKRDFLFILLILDSLVFLLILQVALTFIIIAIESSSVIGIGGASLIIGLLLGFIFPIFIADKVKKPISYFEKTIVFSFLTTVLQYTLAFMGITQVSSVLIIINIIIIMIALTICIKLFLYKTTILERGRVWSYLYVLSFIILFSSTFIFLSWFFLGIPIGFIIVSIFFLHNNKKKSNITLHTSDIKQKKTRIRSGFVKYNFFFAFFSLTAGLATPLEGFVLVVSETFAGNVAIIILLVVMSIIAGAILIGIIFDYIGRIATLSFIIFSIAIANYLSVFQYNIQDFPLAITFSAYFAGLMAVPLLIGDTVLRNNFGKNLSFSFLISAIGLVFGMYVRIAILYLFSDVIFADGLIMGNIFMACVISLLFLLNIKETLPRKEQEWKNFLVGIYIIHESGILIYQNAYVKDDDVSHPDLVSGGIIGLITILKEIIKGESRVRTIDHEDRKLMFTTNGTNEIIFVLVANEDLIIFRNKLDSLAEEFDKDYSDKIEQIGASGLDTAQFKDLKFIVRKYFGA